MSARPPTGLANPPLSHRTAARPAEHTARIELTILLPCLNEARTLGGCLDEAGAAIARAGVKAELLVADNGSTDGSREIALARGARVLTVRERGYGSALRAGIAAARGRYVVIADADGSYDLGEIGAFLERLRAGDQLVMGDRFKGGIAAGAMPWLHRWLGNPILSRLGRLLFSAPIRDFHCGIRGFDRRAVIALGLHTSGMEFASEMVIRASLNGLRISNVPVHLRRDGRDRRPHLQTWRDGWRHLRFMLLFSPRWLFLYPGVALVVIGLVAGTLIEAGPLHLGGINLDIHTLLVAAGVVLLGYQLVGFAVFAKAFAIRGRLHPETGAAMPLLKLPLEVGILAGAAVFLIGIAGVAVAAAIWGRTGFGPLDPRYTMRILIPSLLACCLGAQTLFGSFFLDLLRMPVRVAEPLKPVEAPASEQAS